MVAALEILHNHIRRDHLLTSRKNQDCKLRVIDEERRRIRLDILYFYLETSRECSKDFFKVYDGDDENERVLANNCSFIRNSNYKPIKSSGNSLLIHFHSNEFSDGFSKGFKLKITLGMLRSPLEYKLKFVL